MFVKLFNNLGALRLTTGHKQHGRINPLDRYQWQVTAVQATSTKDGEAIDLTKDVDANITLLLRPALPLITRNGNRLMVTAGEELALNGVIAQPIRQLLSMEELERQQELVGLLVRTTRKTAFSQIGAFLNIYVMERE